MSALYAPFNQGLLNYINDIARGKLYDMSMFGQWEGISYLLVDNSDPENPRQLIVPLFGYVDVGRYQYVPVGSHVVPIDQNGSVIE